MRDRKHAKRRVAEMLGGVRLPVGSRSRKATPAVEYRSLSVEVEIRHRFPGWLSAVVRRAETAAADEQEVPVAVLYEERTCYENALVVMRLKDLVDQREEPEPEMKRPEKDAAKLLVEVYTDGGCLVNPGKGGWAAVIYDKGPTPRRFSGSEQKTTNNRMELQGAIEALRALKSPSKVQLFSDSAYLVNAFKEGWIFNWERNGWRKSNRKPVENQDLWQELLKLSRCHDVQFVKVPGHAGNPGNELAHALVQRELEM